MELNNQNYFSKEMEMKYCGSTQFKRFAECPAKAMAMLKGEWVEKKTTSQLIGSYVDAYFSGEIEEFKANNPEIFKRDGTLKAEFIKAEDIIRRIKNDEMFLKYVSGDNQKIFTGEICGLPFKVKADSFFEDKNVCVDMKIVKDFECIWNPRTNQKENFVDFWKYTWQAAIYSEIIRQNTGKLPKFFIAAATKEEHSDLAILNISEQDLLINLEILKAMIPGIKNIKEGYSEPIRCECCDYCKETRKVSKIIDYRDL